MGRSIIAHPFLFALFQVLFLYNHNIGELAIGAIYAPLAVILLVCFVLWALIALALKSAAKSGLIISLFLILFFSFGHAYNTVMGGAMVIPLYILWPALFLIGSYLCLRTRAKLGNLTGILNVVAGALVVISIFNIANFELKDRRRTEEFAPGATTEPWAKAAKSDGKPPDIFFIVLDGYGRADVLNEVYGHDNTGFIDYLKSKGFYVADNSIANYCQTGLAFASILNMDYLDELARVVGVESINRHPLQTAIKRSRLFSFLRSMGYKVAAFSSGRPETELDDAEMYLNPGDNLNTFKNELINTTPVPLVKSLFATPQTKDKFDLHRKRLLYIMDSMAALAEQKQPVFVFAHIEAPHPPFVFGADGEKVSYEVKFNDHDANWLIRKGRLTMSQYLNAYRAQLVFINKKMKGVVDELLKSSGKPPVIVIMGDHGPRSMLTWEKAEYTYFPESMTNLNALYLPGDAEAPLYAGISPVNTFRVILNRYFSTDLELLDDKSYFSTSKHLYKFIDVTDKVLTPDTALMHIKLGNGFSMEGNFAKAVERYKLAVVLSPDNALVHNSYAAALAETGEYKAAMRHLLEAARLDPEYEAPRKNIKKLEKVIAEHSR